MTFWPFDRRLTLWAVASVLLSAFSLALGGQPSLVLPLVSAASFALTVLFAKFPARIPDDLGTRSELLSFCTDLSVDMSSGMSAESALSRRLQGESQLLSPIRDPVALRMLSGAGANHVLKLLPGETSRTEMRDIFCELVNSGNADSASAGPFLDLWAMNLATAIESRRSFEEISRRAEFLYYLISFTMGFLSASASMMSRLKSPYSLQPMGQPMGWSPHLAFISLFLLNSSTFIISSRRFQFGRPLIRFAIGSLVMITAYLLFNGLLSVF